MNWWLAYTREQNPVSKTKAKTNKSRIKTKQNPRVVSDTVYVVHGYGDWMVLLTLAYTSLSSFLVSRLIASYSGIPFNKWDGPKQLRFWIWPLITRWPCEDEWLHFSVSLFSSYVFCLSGHHHDVPGDYMGIKEDRYANVAGALSAFPACCLLSPLEIGEKIPN